MSRIKSHTSKSSSLQKYEDNYVASIFAPIEYEASINDVSFTFKDSTIEFFTLMLKLNKGQYPGGSRLDLRRDMVAYDLLADISDKDLRETCQLIWKLCLAIPKSKKQAKKIYNSLVEIGEEIKQTGGDLLLSLIFKFSPSFYRKKLLKMWDCQEKRFNQN